MKVLIILLALTSCKLITEYTESEVLEVRVFKVGECDLNLFGVQVKNDTIFRLPVSEASRFITGRADNANLTVSASGNDNLKIDIKGYINIVYFRR